MMYSNFKKFLTASLMLAIGSTHADIDQAALNSFIAVAAKSAFTKAAVSKIQNSDDEKAKTLLCCADAAGIAQALVMFKNAYDQGALGKTQQNLSLFAASSILVNHIGGLILHAMTKRFDAKDKGLKGKTLDIIMATELTAALLQIPVYDETASHGRAEFKIMLQNLGASLDVMQGALIDSNSLESDAAVYSLLALRTAIAGANLGGAGYSIHHLITTDIPPVAPKPKPVPKPVRGAATFTQVPDALDEQNPWYVEQLAAGSIERSIDTVTHQPCIACAHCKRQLWAGNHLIIPANQNHHGRCVTCFYNEAREYQPAPMKINYYTYSQRNNQTGTREKIEVNFDIFNTLSTLAKKDIANPEAALREALAREEGRRLNPRYTRHEWINGENVEIPQITEPEAAANVARAREALAQANATQRLTNPWRGGNNAAPAARQTPGPNFALRDAIEQRRQDRLNANSRQDQAAEAEAEAAYTSRAAQQTWNAELNRWRRANNISQDARCAADGYRRLHEQENIVQLPCTHTVCATCYEQSNNRHHSFTRRDTRTSAREPGREIYVAIPRAAQCPVNGCTQ